MISRFVLTPKEGSSSYPVIQPGTTESITFGIGHGKWGDLGSRTDFAVEPDCLFKVVTGAKYLSMSAHFDFGVTPSNATGTINVVGAIEGVHRVTGDRKYYVSPGKDCKLDISGGYTASMIPGQLITIKIKNDTNIPLTPISSHVNCSLTD